MHHCTLKQKNLQWRKILSFFVYFVPIFKRMNDIWNKKEFNVSSNQHKQQNCENKKMNKTNSDPIVLLLRKEIFEKDFFDFFSKMVVGLTRWSKICLKASSFSSWFFDFSSKSLFRFEKKSLKNISKSPAAVTPPFSSRPSVCPFVCLSLSPSLSHSLSNCLMYWLGLSTPSIYLSIEWFWFFSWQRQTGQQQQQPFSFFLFLPTLMHALSHSF